MAARQSESMESIDHKSSTSKDLPYTDTSCTVLNTECSATTQCGEDLCGSETVLPVAGETDSQEETNMKKLLSKLKSEEMFELRKLKHHQRPVSEFSSKQRLEQILLTNCKQASSNDVRNSASSTAQATSLTHNRVKEFDSRAQAAQSAQQNPQDLMPESVQLEIRGLFERRVVTGVLQSPVQAEIERVVQEQQQQQRRPRRRRARPPPAEQREAGAAGRLMAAVRGGARSRAASYHRRARHSRPPMDGNYSMPRRDQARILDHLRQSPALNSLDQEAREEIVSEVSNLVHQQLVTSALSGEFRGVLELHIQERVDRVSDGLTSEDFLQSLNHRSYGRSNTENNSLRVEGGASHDEVHREMQEMKSQLAELKQMMRVSFDLQMDIQRSIRQEVAAALSMFLASPPQAAVLQGSPGLGNTTQAASLHSCPIPTLRQVDASVSSQTDGARVVEAGHCVICSDGVIDSVVYRCGHMCVCMACGLELKGQGLKCPICRAPITDVIRAYASML